MHDAATRHWLDQQYDEFAEEIELLEGASHEPDQNKYIAGRQTPVLFGSALQNFGIDHLLHEFARISPQPQSRETNADTVSPADDRFSGFVFKIQANMNPRHRDRIAFLRVCSGVYRKGMRMRHVRLDRDVKVSDAVTFMAGERSQADEAYAGDIIGLHNHGTIQIGDSFSEGDNLVFRGVPNFAPETLSQSTLERSDEIQTSGTRGQAVIGRRCQSSIHATHWQRRDHRCNWLVAV